MTRLSDWGVDLGRLTLIDAIFNDVVDRRATIEQARARIRAIVKQPHLWSPALVWAATTVAAGSAAVFFRGALVDVLVASIVGAAIGGAHAFFEKKPAHRLLSGVPRRTLRGIVRLARDAGLAHGTARGDRAGGSDLAVPGMTFTTGLAEVAQKNLVSGGARLMESAVTLLLILFGVALVAGFQQISGVHLPPHVESLPIGLGCPIRRSRSCLRRSPSR